VLEFARALALDMERFHRDLQHEGTRRRVVEDVAAGRRNGVTGTPTVFIDGIRYNGAWDFYSMLEALERPIANRVERSARAFASLPASGGMVLLVAAAAAILCANTSLAPYYRMFIESSFSIGPPDHILSLTIGAWFSEGLLAIFFLLVGLEIRREMTVGALADRRAAILPVIAAFGGVLAPAAIYLVLNPGPTAVGWSVPTATDIAFTLGILALLGDRIPSGLRIFVAALAVVDDILSVLTLAIFYPRGFAPNWLLASAADASMRRGLTRSPRLPWGSFCMPPAFMPPLQAYCWPPSCRRGRRRRSGRCSLRRPRRSRSSNMRSTKQSRRERGSRASNKSRYGIGQAVIYPRQASASYPRPIASSRRSHPGVLISFCRSSRFRRRA
jgi:hypothetical protein